NCNSAAEGCTAVGLTAGTPVTARYTPLQRPRAAVVPPATSFLERLLPGLNRAPTGLVQIGAFSGSAGVGRLWRAVLRLRYLDWNQGEMSQGNNRMLPKDFSAWVARPTERASPDRP